MNKHKKNSLELYQRKIKYKRIQKLQIKIISLITFHIIEMLVGHFATPQPLASLKA